jgi:hypothetical protein
VRINNNQRAYVYDFKDEHDGESPLRYPCDKSSSVLQILVNDSLGFQTGQIISTFNLTGSTVPNTNPVKYYGKSYCK